MLVVEDPSFSQSVTYLPQYKAIIINDAQQNPTNYALGHEYTHYLDDIFGNDLSDVLSGENNANHLAYEAAKIELQTSMKSGDPDKAMQAWMKYHAFPTERRALAGGLAMFVFQGMTENQYVQEFMGIGTPNSTLSADMQSQMAVFLKGVYADAARLASFG